MVDTNKQPDINLAEMSDDEIMNLNSAMYESVELDPLDAEDIATRKEYGTTSAQLKERTKSND